MVWAWWSYDLAVLFHRRRFLCKPCGHHNNIIVKSSHPDNYVCDLVRWCYLYKFKNVYSSRLTDLRILANH